MYRIFITMSFCLFLLNISAQRTTVEEYIEQFKETAISEMKRSGVPAAITLAQGILESENGNSDLVKRSNNHFDIKCKSNWSGESVSHDDDATGECFRAYDNAGDSYRDHSDFLKANKRYSTLFKLDPADYEGWAKGLKKAGYATNPRYPDLLIKYIEQYNLQQYSLAALNELPKMEIAKADDGSADDPLLTKVETAKSKGDAAIGDDRKRISSLNNIKCVFVKKGTSLILVANQNKISLNKLMEYNDMTEDGILSKDQYIYLHKKSRLGIKEFHIVQPGETIFDVAQVAGIQLKYLLEYNNLNADVKLVANTKLFLQPGMRSAINNKEVQKAKLHYVAPREGLYAIAKTYKVTVQELREWNKLDSDDLRIGQEIIVAK